MKAVLWLAGCIFLLAVYPLGAAHQEKEAKEDKFDAAKLIGKWEYVSGEKNGQKVAEASLKDQTMTVSKEGITLKGEAGTFVMKYEVDAKKNPVTIKLTMTESPFGAGAVAAGIIELKGDELKFCYAPESAEAPKKFEAKDGSKHHLFVLKRSK